MRREVELLPVRIDLVSRKVLDAAFRVHTEMGPGLLESVYHECMVQELSLAGLQVQSEHPIPLVYRGVVLNTPLTLDLLVERVLIVELKSVVSLQPIHGSQLLSYLRLTGLRLGLLINFNVPHLRQGIKRIIN